MGSYIAAWRRIHHIFAAEGANHLVVWVWAPNRIDPLNPTKFPPIERYYPAPAMWTGSA